MIKNPKQDFKHSTLRPGRYSRSKSSCSASITSHLGAAQPFHSRKLGVRRRLLEVDAVDQHRAGSRSTLDSRSRALSSRRPIKCAIAAREERRNSSIDKALDNRQLTSDLRRELARHNIEHVGLEEAHDLSRGQGAKVCSERDEVVKTLV